MPRRPAARASCELGHSPFALIVIHRVPGDCQRFANWGAPVSTQLGSARQNRWPQLAGEVLRMAFWGVCGALAVVAVAMVHDAPQARAAAERQVAAEVAAENRAYCEKWGMRAGTREHVICTLDLDEIRARQAKRLAVGVQGLI
jgi:hypothetical protein